MNMESDFCSLPLVSAWTLLTRWRRISGKKLFLLVARTPASPGPEAGSGGGSGSGTLMAWVSGHWSLVTVSALLRGVFTFISVLWRPSPQCPSVAQPLCPQTCRHADTTGHYRTSWIFATLVYSMNAIKRLHISSYGSLCNIVLYQYLKFGRLHKPKIIYSKFLDILDGHIHYVIY